MKKAIKGLLLIGALVFTMSETQAQVIVRVRPTPGRVVVARPPRPARGHVWVKEDWTVVNGRYVWHGGYWAAPPRPRAVYIPGHWRDTYRGSVWVPGHWR